MRNLVAYISWVIQEPEVECSCLDLVSAINPWKSTCLVLGGNCPPFLQSFAWKQTSSHRAPSLQGRDSLDLLPYSAQAQVPPSPPRAALEWSWTGCWPGSPFFSLPFSSSFLPAETQMDCQAVQRALFSAHCLNWCNFFRNNFLYYIPRGKKNHVQWHTQKEGNLFLGLLIQTTYWYICLEGHSFKAVCSSGSYPCKIFHLLL